MQKIELNVQQLLEKENTKKAAFFFEPLSGNNGDKLIEMGSRELFKRLNLKMVNNPQNANIIIVNGSGGMTAHWGAFEIVKHYIESYPETTIIVLPSSWDLPNESFSSLFKNRSKPCYFFAREKYSYSKLAAVEFNKENIMNPLAFCGLDHDMAFHLKDTDYIKRLVNNSGSEKILIIERTDKEKPTTITSNSMNWIILIKKIIKTIAPKKIHKSLAKIMIMVSKPAKRKRMEKVWSDSNFTLWAQKLVLRNNNNLKSAKVISQDISDHTVYSFKDFEDVMSSATVIVTTRLHGAILGAMLGKKTYFVKGVWHKFQGVYEYSLIDYPNVELVEYRTDTL